MIYQCCNFLRDCKSSFAFQTLIADVFKVKTSEILQGALYTSQLLVSLRVCLHSGTRYTFSFCQGRELSTRRQRLQQTQKGRLCFCSWHFPAEWQPEKSLTILSLRAQITTYTFFSYRTSAYGWEKHARRTLLFQFTTCYIKWLKFPKKWASISSEFCSCSDISSEEHGKIQKAQQRVRNYSIKYIRKENKISTEAHSTGFTVTKYQFCIPQSSVTFILNCMKGRLTVKTSWWCNPPPQTWWSRNQPALYSCLPCKNR